MLVELELEGRAIGSTMARDQPWTPVLLVGSWMFQVSIISGFGHFSGEGRNKHAMFSGSRKDSVWRTIKLAARPLLRMWTKGFIPASSVCVCVSSLPFIFEGNCSVFLANFAVIRFQFNFYHVFTLDELRFSCHQHTGHQGSVGYPEGRTDFGHPIGICRVTWLLCKLPTLRTDVLWLRGFAWGKIIYIIHSI